MGNANRQRFIDYLSIAYPVRSLLVYRGDVGRVLRVHGSSKVTTRGNRRPIVQLSKKSRQRLAFVALATPVAFYSMITLTYPAAFPLDGKVVKRQLHTFLKRLRRDYIASYIWVIEFQKRGAPHFHIMTDWPAIQYSDRIWLATTWAECLGYGKQPYVKTEMDLDELDELQKVLKVHTHADSWQDIRETNGARHYIVKYATKTYQKTVPDQYRDVGRFWGNSADVTAMIKPDREILLDETTLRDTLESIGNGAYDLPILPKYIWAVKTGSDTCQT